MLVAAAVGALGNVVGTAIAGVDTIWNIAVADFGLIILANVLGMLVGFMLGVVFRNSAGAIVGYFVITLVLPGIAEALRNTSEWFSANAAVDRLQHRHRAAVRGRRRPDRARPGRRPAFTTLVWVLIPLAIGMRFLLRSEIK